AAYLVVDAADARERRHVPRVEIERLAKPLQRSFLIADVIVEHAARAMQQRNAEPAVVDQLGLALDRLHELGMAARRLGDALDRVDRDEILGCQLLDPAVR